MIQLENELRPRFSPLRSIKIRGEASDLPLDTAISSSIGYSGQRLQNPLTVVYQTISGSIEVLPDAGVRFKMTDVAPSRTDRTTQ